MTCVEFNSIAREEQSKLIAQWKRFFTKMAALMKEHHKNKMRKDNKEATRRQLMMLQNEDGVRRAVTMG